ncbi:MAG: Uma2 family endonuclease [Deltaproteobacteria bacterium]|nr:Uma2 family endonuclease [Deltaproteobacteria bacterium]
MLAHVTQPLDCASEGEVPGYVPGTEPLDIPYCDEELRLIALEPHALAIRFFSTLDYVADATGLKLISDQPVRYERIDDVGEKDYGLDLALSKKVSSERQLASDLLLVLEVVSTQDSRKEKKDTIFNKVLNEQNGVPELYLFFPDGRDERSIVMYQLDERSHAYVSVVPDAEGRLVSRSVPGLSFVLLPRAQWRDGRKLELWFRGERLLPTGEAIRRAQAEQARAEDEKARAEDEKARAEDEKARAEDEKARAEDEKARADRLAAQLRALGVDPDA